MKNNRTTFCNSITATLAALAVAGSILQAQEQPHGTAFTYQGHLEEGGVAATGDYEFQFALFPSESAVEPVIGGEQQVITRTVMVEDGQFTTSLDFGDKAAGPMSRWLGIAVRPAGSPEEFAMLPPNVELKPIPNASYAVAAGTLSPGATVDGDITISGSISAGQISGSGSQLTNIPSAALSGPIPGSALAGTYGGAVTFSNTSNKFAGDGEDLKGIWRLNPPRGQGNFGQNVLVVNNQGWIGVNPQGFVGTPRAPFEIFGRARSDGLTLSSASVASNDMATIQAEHRLGGAGLGIRFIVDNALSDKTAMEISSNGDAVFFESLQVNGVVSGDGSGLTNLNLVGDGSGLTNLDLSSLRVSQLDAPDGNPTAAVYLNNSGHTFITSRATISGTLTCESGAIFEKGLICKQQATVPSLRITSGADIAEPFDVATPPQMDAEPGMVVAIDPHNPGALKLSAGAYDRTVAGIISGAGGVNTGMTLSQDGSIAAGEHPVALTGRVYCYVDADAGGAVQPGDLLTTSDTPGHAMAVRDHSRASGAIIGKAMTPLEQGKGLVLVLVSLQ